MSAVVVLADAEALRDHLDALNDAGDDFRAAGIDARQEPFLICLDGCYTETEVVFFGSPWDREVDYGTGRRCDDCWAAYPHKITDLHYPVTVLRRAES